MLYSLQSISTLLSRYILLNVDNVRVRAINEMDIGSSSAKVHIMFCVEKYCKLSYMRCGGTLL